MNKSTCVQHERCDHPPPSLTREPWQVQPAISACLHTDESIPAIVLNITGYFIMCRATRMHTGLICTCKCNILFIYANTLCSEVLLNGVIENWSLAPDSAARLPHPLSSSLQVGSVPRVVICAHTHTRTHTHTHTHTHMHAHMHAHTHIHTHTHAHARTCTHTCTDMCRQTLKEGGGDISFLKFLEHSLLQAENIPSNHYSQNGLNLEH